MSTPYVRELENMFPYTQKIEQQGSKQCAVVTHADGSKALYSYRTKVGRFTNGFWVLTTIKYNRTTSKHLNLFARNSKIPVVRQEDIDIEPIGEMK
jgi:hypothetical protein